jgi:carboxymethylenebutenolidase
MHEKNIIIKTKDGNLDCTVFKNNTKNAPTVIFYMDAPGIREELRTMCRRILKNGYNVLLPNLFYRVGIEGDYPFNQLLYKKSKEELDKMISTMNNTTNNMIIEDTKYIIDYINNNFDNSNGIGIVGYCMSGRFVVSCGALYADKISAVASFYGVDIFTEKDDSPHLIADKIKGELYLAFAEKDKWVPKATLSKIKKNFSKYKKCSIEVYPSTEHGFAFPERNTYVKKAAEKHWEKLIHLFEKNLKKK